MLIIPELSVDNFLFDNFLKDEINKSDEIRSLLNNVSIPDNIDVVLASASRS